MNKLTSVRGVKISLCLCIQNNYVSSMSVTEEGCLLDLVKGLQTPITSCSTTFDRLTKENDQTKFPLKETQ